MVDEADLRDVVRPELQDVDAKPGLLEILERGIHRGYILASELNDLHDPLEDDADWIEDAAQKARDLGMQVVDDLTADADRPSPNPLSSSTDSVRQYLDGIGRTELLTAEEEVDLSKRDHAGRAAKAYLQDENLELSPDKRAMLQAVARDGQRSHEHMIRANLRLVVSVARRYRGRGLGLLGLIQEGNLGLIRAVEKFDYKKGYKFSTYATWWIRQALTRGTANKARVIRLPVHVHELVGKIRRAELDLLQEHGRDAKEEEVAEMLDLTIERLREIKHAAAALASLDKPVGEDGDTTMGELVPDDTAVSPEAAASFKLAQNDVKDALASLDERERGVLMMRFGLMDGETRTLEEIGEHYGVTRERIRQIEKKTLTKLRHPARAEKLRGLVEAASEGEEAAY
ncbi:MAG: sigma-70 family RNA polymerase sigma factor [Actinobacteria bacterium]|nr:sigma-70 family RNA polymerase sigma factor [Actinomycetota bacterium]